MAAGRPGGDDGRTVTRERSRMSVRNLIRSLFSRSSRDQHVERYVVREHGRGRSLEEILDDAYVRNRTTEEQRARIVERPEVIAAVRKHLASGATTE
jgi:hypothetical protein